MTTTSPELLLRWSGGELDLMGVNDGDYGEFEIATLADGTEWGNPQSVRRTLRRFLLDGSTTRREYDDNRTVTLRLRVKASDGTALAGGEAALVQTDSRRCELVWTAPDEFAAPALFIVDSVDLAHSLDDLGELRRERFYTLTLSCLPHTYSDAWVTVAPVTQTISTPTTVDDCSSLTGWTATNATLSLISGTIVATVAAGVTDWTVTRTGTVDFTTDRYLRLTAANFFLADVTAAGASKPRVAIDGNAQVYDMGTVSAPSIVFTFHRSFAENSYAGTVFDLLQKQATTRSVTSKQHITSLAVPGSRRTSGSVLVESPSGTGLGDVLLYTGPDYDPTMSPYVLPGTDRRVISASALSGGVDNLNTGTTTAYYRRPVAGLPAGEYAIWARAAAFHAGFAGGGLEFVANLRKPDGTLLSTFPLGSVPFALAESNLTLYPVAWATLPGWALPEDSDLMFEIAATWDGSTSAPGGASIDEILLFEISQGTLSIVSAGANTHVWFDAPSLTQDSPRLLVGSSSSKPSSVALSLATQVAAWGGTHALTTPRTNAYIGASGVAGAKSSFTFRPAWHTNPAA